MKCDFCGKPSSEATLIAGNRKSICEFCIGDAVDVALGTKEARPIEIGDKVTVCDICESETSIYYLSRNELHICVHCIGSCLESVALGKLEKRLEGAPMKLGKSPLGEGTNFEF